MDSSYYLALLAMAAGILLLLGTMVLLFFRRIYLDSETNQPVRFSLPLFGNISTQTPVIALVLCGVFLVAYAQWKFKPLETQEVPVTGYIDPGGESILVKIIPDQYEGSALAPGPFSHKIPVCDKNTEYRILFLEGKEVIDDQPLKQVNDGPHRTDKGTGYVFNDVVWTTTPEESISVATKKDVSDEQAPKRSKPH
jgi:hypothetical protein